MSSISLILFIINANRCLCAYRENYVIDEETNYECIDVWIFDKIEQKISIDYNGESKTELYFEIEDTIQDDLIKQNYINGWNTSVFMGEFDSS